MAEEIRLRVALVAGHGEQQEEHVELELAQLLAFDLGIDEDADEVVRGRGAALRRELVGVRVEL
ncbi:MAG TPA: hypothetical protein VE395_08000, partial [Acidimicrobiales bacterium]|nr:hypothetical protein [Acidimicrobiales bacterium]